jgi:hypothetical protein
LQSSERKRILVDSNAPWRGHPASIKQVYRLHKFGIKHSPDITAGEASDILSKAFADQEKARIEKKLAKLQKSETGAKRGKRRASA